MFYCAELLLALEAVHYHRVVHRAVSPKNVFIGTDGE